MAQAPPVPPRPLDYSDYRPSSLPPPVPQYRPIFVRKKHEQPLAAPRPHRIDPSIGANMARTLDEPGFVVPPSHMPPPPPQLQNRSDWSPWAPPMNQQLTFSAPQPPQAPQPPPPLPHHQPSQPPPVSAPSPPISVAPALTAPLPTIANLQGALHAIQNPQHDPFLKVAWCRDVFFLVDRAQQNPSPSTDPAVGPVVINDPLLHRLAHVAVPTILQLANATQTPLPQYAAEATYWRAMFAASGAYPEFITHNPRVAFRDFETAARGGYAIAWFRLGRDYENFKDTQRARECFERGVKLGVESCTYRMGMAHLLGQLGLTASPQQAIPLLQRAATLATTNVPQPAYVFSLLLLNEFTQTSIPPTAFGPFLPQGSSPLLEARKHLERAAYLHFAPAQYKLGHAYEYAQPPFPFDPLLSVQYYSLASQQGEVEADMALSKWFLCGSGDTDGGAGFDKDEALALTFAEKAAKKGLHSAEFAMGYYAEVGVGRAKDIQGAIRWYTRARDHGNSDAEDRLKALEQPMPQMLSRQEHDTITDDKLVRKRTQAKQRSDASRPAEYRPQVQNGHLAVGGPGGGPPGPSGMPMPPQQQQQQQQRADGRMVVDGIRKQSMMESQAYNRTSPPRQHQQLQQQPQPQQPAHQPRPQNSRPQMSRPQSNISTMSGRTGYSLTDSPMTTPPPGSGPHGAPGGGTGPGGGPGGRLQRPGGGGGPGGPGGGMGFTDAPPSQGHSKPQKSGPATFAEMGIQGAKAENDSCVIM
ncbi:hypothetical protein D9756_010911 [Leucocoprinus leucothites]|uniref:HCP-like protein n=1 Tax=Leucocoprinus leucothites TaxID=201217 RepID=A0A8H5FR22_9AGAR|nr:hypothetical protein D9756_010911 [Leucoagaricus leucothites]